MTDTQRQRRAPHSTAVLMAAVILLGVAAFRTPAGAASPRIALTPIGSFETAQFDESAAEIVAHDPKTQRLFVVNALAGAIDVLDITDPTDPTLVDTLTAAGGTVNSVDVHGGVMAVAVEADPAQQPGAVELYDTTALELLSSVEVGSLPDMLTFTPDGSKVVVANEGEPDGYCPGGVDPEGSVSIIDVSGGAADVDDGDVRTATFDGFDADIDALTQAGVRIFGPEATVAEDLEPEYVAVDSSSETAWVALQENNAFATVDLASATVTDLVPLGFKDHSRQENALDASNDDGAINIQPWPVHGMYMPDGMDSYEHGRRTYLVTANEGDARDYDCFSEELRIRDLDLDPSAFPDTDVLQTDERLGRLNTTTSFATTGLARDDDGVWEAELTPADTLYSYGGRSFSIWNADGKLVFDSGDDFERITAGLLPDEFNSNNDENGSFDARSDDKGPEPEGIEIATVYDKTYAFIGLERIGGLMAYDITTPSNPRFVQYVTTRDFTGDAEAGTAGDLGPEGLTFIAPDDSPNGEALLVVGHEVSGSTTIFRIDGPGRPR